MKGLILIAGKGTRLRPLTYSQPKTLLPVAGRSVFTYAIESLYTLGIQEIGVVLNPSQENAVRKNINKI
jgi:glucose-1-phosphate thymidylyltransferase